ncbi:hypothetical protein D3C81_2337440 [compost metagenome]
MPSNRTGPVPSNQGMKRGYQVHFSPSQLQITSQLPRISTSESAKLDFQQAVLNIDFCCNKEELTL